MEKLELFQALGEVDGDLLEDAETFLYAAPEKRRAPAWVKRGGLAACAALAVCAAWLTTRTPMGQPSVEPVPPAPEATTGAANVDRPAVELEGMKRLPVEMDWNELDSEPDMGTAGMFALMAEDFVPMTREELLEYYGVSLPIETLFPDLSASEPEDGGGGLYRRESGDAYFDSNTFSFMSAGEVYGVNITLDKVFHLPVSPWELPGDSLRFTTINGWELALFLYPDEEGNQVFYTEFTQNGVNYRVTGKNMAEQAFAAILESLLEDRSDFAPGEVRTVTGTYTGGLSRQTLTADQLDGSAGGTSADTFVSYRGPLGLTLEDGSGFLVELTPEQAAQMQFAGLSIGDRVTVRFTGEPATIRTVWTQQLVSIDPEE